MEIIKRNVQRNYKRNNDIVALGTGSSFSGGGLQGLPPLNFLPARELEGGKYIVDASLVTFKGNVVSEKEVTAYGVGSGGSGGGSGEGGTNDYNKLINKPALNGTELTSTSKLKTVNGQSLIGEGDITISGGGSGGTDLALFAFEITNGDLYLITEDPRLQKAFSIDQNGCLIYEIN